MTYFWIMLLAACVVAVPVMAVAEDKDPYLWLEDVTGEMALAWVKEQNAVSTAELTKGPEFKELNDRLLKILDSKDRIPFVGKAGDFYYNFWRDDKNVRGLWRRTTLDEYRKPAPAWETVLDLDALGAVEKENWVWHGATWLEPTYERCLISLSRGGADAAVVREFDPKTKAFVKDGFTLPEAKSNVTWRDRDSMLVGTDFGTGSLTDSGYPRIVKEWKRGTSLTEAKLVYEGKPADVAVQGIKDHLRGFEREFINRATTFWESELFLRKDGKLIKIEKPDDAEASPFREWLLIKLRTPWTVAGKTYAAGALLASGFDAFLKGERKFDVLFEPTERKSLASFSPTLNHIILNELDNVRSRLFVMSRKDGSWARTELPGLPQFGSVDATPVDSNESDDYFLTIQDYLTPVTLSLGTAGKGAAEKLKQSPAFYDAKGLAVSQHEAVSKDGTRVPYFEVSKAELALDGKNPTLLYGYGGFEVSLTPSYSGLVGRLAGKGRSLRSCQYPRRG